MHFKRKKIMKKKPRKMKKKTTLYCIHVLKLTSFIVTQRVTDFVTASGICRARTTQSTSHIFKMESERNEAIYRG